MTLRTHRPGLWPLPGHAHRTKYLLLHGTNRLIKKNRLRISEPKSNRAPALLMVGLLAAFALTIALPLIGAGVGFGAYLHYSQDLPSPDKLRDLKLNQSTKIYDRNGDLLYEMYDPHGGRRTLIEPQQVPPILKDAIVATEDATFDTNPGIDVHAILRAASQLAQHRQVVSGASTITQQLIKNTLLTPDQTFERKIREVILAVQITNQYSKPEILAMYLNTTYFGNQAYGIGAAANAYFDKNVEDLNLAEASLLAGLPQSPANYDPCKAPAAALARQQVVLGLMVAENYVSAQQADDAAAQTALYLGSPAFALHCGVNYSLKSPHFVDYVRADLEQRFGPEFAYNGGLQVYTTYDPQVEAIVEEEARAQIEKLKDQHVTNASVVVERVDDGEIYAMMGSVNFFDTSIDGQVNVADRLRQPGSSIKPINYVTAFKFGWTPATRILDVRTQFPDATGKPYIPINYDERDHGIVTVRTALGNSLNIPAVKTLYFTSDKSDPRAPAPLEMIATARHMGITTFTNADGSPKPFGLALTLGGGEVKLTELTSAYSVFARQGSVIPQTPYLKILDGQGQVLYDLQGKDKPQAHCALFDAAAPDEQPDGNGFCAKSAPYAYQITDILSDDKARLIGFGPNSLLKTPYPSAVKTGTTNDFKDNWTMGYTPQWVVGVWVGNADDTPMIHSTGITGAAPIWRKIMDRITAGAPARPFTAPPGIVKENGDVFVAGKPRISGENADQQKYAIDTRNGLLAGSQCPKEFVSEVVVDLAQLAAGTAPVKTAPKDYSPLCPKDAQADNQNPADPAAKVAANDQPGAGQASAGGVNAQLAGDVHTSDETGSIWGRVLRANGSPAANVTVSIAGPGDSRVATTSPDGNYNFDELKTGTYAVSVNGAALSAWVTAKHRAIVNFSVP